MSNSSMKRVLKVGIGVVCGVALLGIIAVLAGGIFREMTEGLNIGSNVTYTPQGFSGYIDKEKNGFFIQGDEVIPFPGEQAQCLSTPNHTKFLIRQETGKLMLYDEPGSEGVQLELSMEDIVRVNEHGCFFSKTDKSLYYRDFESESSIELGAYERRKYSSRATAFAGIMENGDLYIFSCKETAPTKVYNIDSEAEICCVSDNGSNVVWSVKTGNTFDVYTLKDNIPERIGEIKNSGKYSQVYGFFYNNSNSHLLYSPGSSQALLSDHGTVMDVFFPGITGNNTPQTLDGKTVDSDDDNTSTFLFSVMKKKDSPVADIYRLDKTGELALLLEDVKGEYWVQQPFVIYEDFGIYIDSNGDLVRAKLKDPSSKETLTTDVDDLYALPRGRYIFISKKLYS